VYFNVNFNVYFKLIKVHFLVSELYINHIRFKILIIIMHSCRSISTFRKTILYSFTLL